MKKLVLLSFVTASALACAQTFPKSVQQSATEHSQQQQLAPQSLEDRRAALNALFAEIWQDRLAHDPEFASSIGDKRYDDKLTDYSVEAFNDELQRGRDYLLRLGTIDTTGLSYQEQLSKDLMVRQLVEQQAEAQFKPWEMPITQFNGIQIELPDLVPQLSFDNAKDYDDYTARLDKVPVAFQQITDNATAGIEDGRVPPKFLLEKVLVQVNAIASQKPEDTPFAQPLKKFPASVSADDQTRIRAEVLDAIKTKVLPAYQQLGRFFTKT